MTETTNSAASVAESALSRPLSLEEAASIDFSEPEEDTGEAEGKPQSETATGEAQEGQETDGNVTEVAEQDDGEADAAASKPEPADDVNVTVNGEKVPLSDLKLGYMRQADYSRKTQEVASRRKGLEEMTARATNAVNAVASFLAKQIPEPPDAHLAQSNPSEYVHRKAAHDAAVAQLNELLSQAGEVTQVTQGLTAEQRKSQFEAENAKLNEAFPQTLSTEGRKAFFDTAAATAREMGYSDEEIKQAVDHRLFALAHWAAKGLQAEKAKEKAQAKVQNAPPVAPQKSRQQAPNAAQARRSQEAMKRLARTGSIEDALQVDWT